MNIRAIGKAHASAACAGRMGDVSVMKGPGPGAAVRYDALCRAVAECFAVDDVKQIADKARAVELYARQQHNKELEWQMNAIRLRAQRRMGELLTGLDRHGKATRLAGGERLPPSALKATLDAAGISRSAGVTYEKLAAVDQDVFETEVERRHGAKPSVKQILGRSHYRRIADVTGEEVSALRRFHRIFAKDQDRLEAVFGSEAVSLWRAAARDGRAA